MLSGGAVLSRGGMVQGGYCPGRGVVQGEVLSRGEGDVQGGGAVQGVLCREEITGCDIITPTLSPLYSLTSNFTAVGHEFHH